MSQLQKEEIKLRDKTANRYIELHKKDKSLVIERAVPLWLLNPQSHETILDAGCGVGWLTTILSKKCRKVIAVDFSPNCINLLQQKLEKQKITNVECHVIDLTKRKSLNKLEKVDKVLCVQVLQHIPTHKQRQNFVDNIYGALKSKGTLILTVHNIMPSIWKGKKSKETIVKYYDTDFMLFNKNFGPNELSKLFLQFQKIFISGLVNFWFISSFKYLHKLDMLCSKNRFSRFFGYYLILKGEKRL